MARFREPYHAAVPPLLLLWRNMAGEVGFAARRFGNPRSEVVLVWGPAGARQCEREYGSSGGAVIDAPALTIGLAAFA